MKLIFEGTEEEFKNLKLVMDNCSNALPKPQPKYQTENLWQVQDVQDNYNCTEEEAMEVLEEALQNDATMDQIWFAIHFHAEEMGLEKK